MSRGRDQVSFGDESVPGQHISPGRKALYFIYLLEDLSFTNLQYWAGIHLIPTSAAEQHIPSGDVSKFCGRRSQ
jgi:hypothetical protein